MKLIDADRLYKELEMRAVNALGASGKSRYTFTLDEIFKILQEISGIEWISMEDRPPKYEGFYLCHYQDIWDEGEDVATMYFNGETFGLPGLSDGGIKVLHWMLALWPGTDGEVTIYMTKKQFAHMRGDRHEKEENIESDRKPEDPL